MKYQRFLIDSYAKMARTVIHFPERGVTLSALKLFRDFRVIKRTSWEAADFDFLLRGFRTVTKKTPVVVFARGQIWTGVQTSSNQEGDKYFTFFINRDAE